MTWPRHQLHDDSGICDQHRRSPPRWQGSARLGTLPVCAVSEPPLALHDSSSPLAAPVR
jgi:hypothetical protein